jgi:PAS domain S-box-containing protein
MKNTKHGSQSPVPEGTESSGNYHALFEQAKDAIMVTDFEGNFMDVNNGLCSMFGYSKEELLKMNVTSLLDKEHLQEKPIRYDLLLNGQNVLNERKMLHKDGSIVYVESNAKKLVDNRILVIARDITERKKIEKVLQESEANLHTIFDTTDTIYVLMDNSLQIISYNPRAVDFAKKELGYDIEVSKYFLDYFPEDKRSILMSYMKEALNGNHVNYEVSYPQKAFTDNWYHVRIFHICRNGMMYGLMMAVSDITEKKLLETKLRDQEVQQQKKIIRAVLKAQEVERNRIGQELHDNVNQVLSSIRLFLGMIDDGSVQKKELLHKTKEYIDLAINEIRILSSKQVTPQKKFHLKELIEDLTVVLNENMKGKTTFICNVAEHLSIDEDLKLNIYRIVQEQTNNIVKYADASKAIISISEQNHFLHILIIDNGKGFDLNVKPKGIGLSNIINRIESYNGTVKIETHSGMGCKLEMTVPACRNERENNPGELNAP